MSATYPYEMTTEQLADTFKGCGTIVDSIVKMDGRTGRSRGFGVVEFSDPKEAEKAIDEFHNKNIGPGTGGRWWSGTTARGTGAVRASAVVVTEEAATAVMAEAAEATAAARAGAAAAATAVDMEVDMVAGRPRAATEATAAGAAMEAAAGPAAGPGGGGMAEEADGRGLSDHDIRARLIEREKARVAKDYRVADDIRSELQTRSARARRPEQDVELRGRPPRAAAVGL